MNTDIDTSLMNLVKEYPALYNRQDFNYKNKEEKKKLWNGIACTLPITSDEAEQRWNKLKKQYLTERKKYESGTGALDPPAIIKKMDFLDPHIVQRRQTINNPQVNDASTREPVAGPSADINIADYVKAELGGLGERPASEAESDASLNDRNNLITSRAPEWRRKRNISANNKREDRISQGAVGFGNMVTYFLMDMSNEERKLKMKKIMDELCERE